MEGKLLVDFVNRDCPDAVWVGGVVREVKSDGLGANCRQTYLRMSRHAVDRARREGRLSWADLLEQATAQVLAAGDDRDLFEALDALQCVLKHWKWEVGRRPAPPVGVRTVIE